MRHVVPLAAFLDAAANVPDTLLPQGLVGSVVLVLEKLGFPLLFFFLTISSDVS